MTEFNNPKNSSDEKQSCGKSSCACSEKEMPKKSLEKPAEEIKLDPTRFGDWEVNGRAIDF